MKREPIIQHSLTYAIFFILIALASGCVGAKVRTYSGDNLKKSEVSVIKGRYYYALLFYESIVIESVDGKAVRATKVELLPGKHEIRMKKYVINLFGFPPVYGYATLNVEAGHKYKIKSSLLCDRDDLVEIKDLNTGITVFSGHWY